MKGKGVDPSGQLQFFFLIFLRVLNVSDLKVADG